MSARDRSRRIRIRLDLQVLRSHVLWFSLSCAVGELCLPAVVVACCVYAGVSRKDGLMCLDYTQHAEKAYDKSIQSLKPDLEAYKKAKSQALSKGQLVTTPEGTLLAVDEDRTFYADANSLGITDHKPSKEALDRLVEETKKRYFLLFVLQSLILGRRKERRNGGRRGLRRMMARCRLLINGTRCLIRSCRGMCLSYGFGGRGC